MINCIPLEFMVLVEAVVAFPFPCVGTKDVRWRYNVLDYPIAKILV